MKFEPFEDRVLIDPDQVEKIGNIYVPSTSKEANLRSGSVVAVGPGIWQNGVFIDMFIKVGDRIHFGHFSGIEIELEQDGQKKKFRVMKQNEVLGKILD